MPVHEEFRKAKVTNYMCDKCLGQNIINPMEWVGMEIVSPVDGKPRYLHECGNCKDRDYLAAQYPDVELLDVIKEKSIIQC